MPLASKYDVISDFDEEPGADELTTHPHWIVAVIRLGMPLSFSRAKLTSVTKDLTQGALLRAEKPLVITDDIFQLNISSSKHSPEKSLTASIKQTDFNYLVEVLPGDWVMSWLTNNAADYESLLARIDRGEPCNDFDDGLKFIGRVKSIRKSTTVERGGGAKTSTFSLSCTGFEELQTTFFYDQSLASKDELTKDLGQWLTRIGLNVEDLFRDAATGGVRPNNINDIIPTLLDLIVGSGPKTASRTDASISLPGRGADVTATPQLDNEAPYSYVIPVMIGKLLGKNPQNSSKPGGVMGYADILNLVIGVQEYAPSDFADFLSFAPKGTLTGNRFETPKKLLGTFLPFMPEFTNRPLWSVFQQFLNPTVNEMYTALRVDTNGSVVPTLTVRQIPFSTEAFTPDARNPGSTSPVGEPIPYTKFLNVPRWVIPDVMVSAVDVGRSDATRANFVHIYGSSSVIQKNLPIQDQMVNNPPIRDDLDIMRSGIHPYMTTVECWIDDQTGSVPTQWMSLVADWTIGSQYTLNGTIHSLGIQSPICEGDNLEFDGVVYHLEAVSHTCGIDMGGNKTWTTTVQLTNGMRAEVEGDTFGDTGGAFSTTKHPIYPGFEKFDNTKYDPGLSLEQRLTTGGETLNTSAAAFDSDDNQTDRSDGVSQLKNNGVA